MPALPSERQARQVAAEGKVSKVLHREEMPAPTWSISLMRMFTA